MTGAAMGSIEIRGLRVMCHVGVPEAERAVPQPIEFDLDLVVDLDAAASSDSVSDTVDYGAVSEAGAAAVTSGPHALLERLAGLAADAALAVDQRSVAVSVTVRKLRPPVPVDVATTAVRLHRARS